MSVGFAFFGDLQELEYLFRGQANIGCCGCGDKGVPEGGGFADAEAGDVVAAGDGGVQVFDSFAELSAFVEGRFVAAVDDALGLAFEFRRIVP